MIAKELGTTGIQPGEVTAFFTDSTICIGCKACEVACKEWNNLEADDYNLSGFFYDNTLAADLLQSTWGGSLPVRLLSGAGRLGSTLFGMPFHNYTGVLIGTTAIPVWNERVSSLPGHFGMSGLQAGVSILELMGHENNRSLNLLGLLSASMEAWEQVDIDRSSSRALLPLKHGASGALVQAGAWLSGPLPLLLRLGACLPGKHSRLRRLAALSAIAGSLLTRYGWVQAGGASSRDWRLPLKLDAPEEEREPASAFQT